jgi:hypothetical protein
VLTPAQKNGIRGNCMAKVFNAMADGTRQTVEMVANQTGVKITTVPSLLRAIRQRGFKVAMFKRCDGTFYQLDLAELQGRTP